MTEITTSRFKLRPFATTDSLAFTNKINTKTIARDTTIPLPWGYDNVCWWIAFITKAANERPPSELHFVIEIDGEMAGSIGYINVVGHRGELGYWLEDKYFGQGIMTEVVGVVTDHLAKKLNVKRIFAPILPHNKASSRVLEKNGFLFEGTLKKYYYKDSKYIDALCYAKTY